jgi:lipoprotein-anchoring transpeptidase ErfK/SrfK
MEGTRVSEQGVCFRGARPWQLAIFAAGTLAVASHAEAAIYFWQDSVPAVTQPAPKPSARHAKGPRHGDKKSGALIEKASKPQGPLIISISIAQQKLRLYDANGLFAESPVSTGMAGHPTPMGVFSVIQKQKFHRSNIYSGAPMPFMQRITWSGVAMHAGVLPGYPASHGCIRMPAAFAIKMYGWTKMGARVIVTPGDVTPASFSHPLLATLKAVPQPVAVEETKADVVATRAPEKPVQAEAREPPAITEGNIELRSTVGHIDAAAAPSDGALQSAEPKVAGEAARAAVETDAPDAGKHDEATASDEKPTSEKSAEAETAKATNADAGPIEVATDQKAIRVSDTVAESSPKASSVEAPKSNAQAEISGQRPADAATTTADTPISQAVAPAAPTETPPKSDLKGDFSKTFSKPDPGFAFQGMGQIAVFVSRKDSKLYIRQNFAPLFQTPVTIAADTRPLGTHIFTAQVDSNDRNVLHWSVVSLPAPSRSSERRAEEDRHSRGRKFASAGPIEAKPMPIPDGPAEALDRLSLPTEVMAKIYEAVSTGGSIIVSDQGIAAGETGEGTDFIVSLR